MLIHLKQEIFCNLIYVDQNPEYPTSMSFDVCFRAVILSVICSSGKQNVPEFLHF